MQVILCKYSRNPVVSDSSEPNEGSDDNWVNLIPHTLTATTFGALRLGTRVNVEVDIIARYLERLLSQTTTEEVST